ncbi:MAG: hypothetical protein H6722_05630 [Sandaracinus sp.]|nr:hypothetical protein [Sandaracinus sp.]MCB9611921.1 hypothetical protein [Sandaracinus sp.]
MTFRALALAFAGVLVSLGAVAPTAHACGGYGSFDPDDAAARSAVYSFVRARPQLEGAYVHITSLTIDGDSALAEVVVPERRGFSMRLTRRDDGTWRVRRWRRTAAPVAA